MMPGEDETRVRCTPRQWLHCAWTLLTVPARLLASGYTPAAVERETRRIQAAMTAPRMQQTGNGNAAGPPAQAPPA